MVSWFLIGLIIAIPAVLVWYSGPSTRPRWLFRGFFLLIFLIFVLTALLS
jgi:tryptophan-rich sensory protein